MPPGSRAQSQKLRNQFTKLEDGAANVGDDSSWLVLPCLVLGRCDGCSVKVPESTTRKRTRGITLRNTKGIRDMDGLLSRRSAVMAAG